MQIQTANQFLTNLSELLQQGWCKDAYAVDKDNNPCAINSPEAKCYCLIGATERLANVSEADAYHEAMEKLRKVVYNERNGYFRYFGRVSLTTFNDRAESVSEIVAVIDKAKEL